MWTPLPEPANAAGEGATTVWAGDRLVIWGGYSCVDTDPLEREGKLLDTGWTWTP